MAGEAAKKTSTVSSFPFTFQQGGVARFEKSIYLKSRHRWNISKHTALLIVYNIIQHPISGVVVMKVMRVVTWGSRVGAQASTIPWGVVLRQTARLISLRTPKRNNGADRPTARDRTTKNRYTWFSEQPSSFCSPVIADRKTETLAITPTSLQNRGLWFMYYIMAEVVLFIWRARFQQYFRARITSSNHQTT